MTTSCIYRLRRPYSPTDRVTIIKQLRSMFSVDMYTTFEFLDLLIKDGQFVLQDATKLRYSGYVNDPSAHIEEIYNNGADVEYYRRIVESHETGEALFSAGCSGDVEAALKFCQYVKQHGWGQAFA